MKKSKNMSFGQQKFLLVLALLTLYADTTPVDANAPANQDKALSASQKLLSSKLSRLIKQLC